MNDYSPVLQAARNARQSLQYVFEKLPEDCFYRALTESVMADCNILVGKIEGAQNAGGAR